MSKMKINVNEAVTNRLQVEPVEKYGNFCFMKLTGVKYQTKDQDANKKWEFKGLTTGSLLFEFMGHKFSADEKDRYHTEVEGPITSVNVKGEPLLEANVVKRLTEMWRRVKHLHDQFAGCENYKPIDFDVEFEPSATVPVKKRLELQNKFLSNVADAFNIGKDGKNPIWDDSTILCAKLIATERTSTSGTVYRVLAFPTFVGKGFLEANPVLVDGKFNTVLKFGPNESVDLMGTKIQKLDEEDAGSGAPQGLMEKLKQA